MTMDNQEATPAQSRNLPQQRTARNMPPQLGPTRPQHLNSLPQSAGGSSQQESSNTAGPTQNPSQAGPAQRFPPHIDNLSQHPLKRNIPPKRPVAMNFNQNSREKTLPRSPSRTNVPLSPPRKSSDSERVSLVEEKPESANPQPESSTRNLIFGYLMVFLHALFMTASSASVQALKNRIPHFELVLMRFLTLTIVASVFLLFKRESPRVVADRKSQGLLVMTAIINTTTFTLYYASSYFISLGPIGGVYRATTLIVSTFLAKCLLKERLNGVKVIALTASVIGMVLIVFPAVISAEVEAVLEAEKTESSRRVQHINIDAPASIEHLLGLNHSSIPILEYTNMNSVDVSPNGNPLSNNSIKSNESIIDDNSQYFGKGLMPLVPPRLKVLGYVLIIVAGLFNSSELILLSGYLRGISSSVQAFWFGIFGTVISTVIMLFTETPELPSTADDTLLLCVHGIGAAMSIFTFIFALKYLQASSAAITQSVHIVLMYIAQWTVMNRWNAQFVSFLNLAQLAGTILIIIGVLSLPVNDIVQFRLRRKYSEMK